MKFKNNIGITLIALVVTIIVLLILAGVSIAMLTGENGILTQAQNAKEETTKSEEEEKIKMAVMGSSINDDGFVEMIDETSFKNELKNQFGNQKLDVVVNGDGSFIITVEDTQRKYYVNDDKTVINSDNIIEIGTAEELKEISQNVRDGNNYEGKAILLTNNIDLEGVEWIPIGYYPTENSSPADETNKPFKGIFDGCGHEVDNFTINTTDKVQGLFGLVDSGKVANVGIGSNSNINGGTGTAGVVACAYNGTKVYNCYNKTSITGTDNVSGIVAIALENSVIQNCYNLASINGNSSVAGIVGTTRYNILIKNCYNEGNITATVARVGGILGHSQPEKEQSSESRIILCYNKGSITANGELSNSSSAGGILGYNVNSKVSSCYNSGAITGQFGGVGGIIGLNRDILENSYNRGTINGPSDTVGSIVGYNEELLNYEGATYIGKTTNCYSLEGVASKLFGVNSSIVGSECSFKTSDELKKLYEVLGNDFKEDIEGINNGYPILEWQ